MLAIVGRRKGGSPARPAVRRRWKLERWQTVVAAVIAAVASLCVAVVTTLGSSSGTSKTVIYTASPTAAAGPARSVGPVAHSDYVGANNNPMTVTISEITTSPLTPPAESYSFKGMVQNFPSPSSQNFIFIIVRNPRAASGSDKGQIWLVSPPAQIDGSIWFISNWDISSPPVNAEWTPVIVGAGSDNGSLGANGVYGYGNAQGDPVSGYTPAPAPPESYAPVPSESYYAQELEAYGGSGADVFLVGNPIKTRYMHPRGALSPS